MSHTDAARRTRHEIPKAIEARTRMRIDHAVGRARLVLLWEALWPRIAPLGALAAVFLSVSWFGVWQLLPDWIRMVGLGLFAIVALVLVFRLVRLDLPSRQMALARVERSSGVAHRPATAYADRLATATDDPAGQTLWHAHRRRLLASLDRLRAGQPRPGMAARDPFALRFLTVLVLIVAFFYAGPERSERINQAFVGGEPIAAIIARIDAWVITAGFMSLAFMGFAGLI